MKNFDKNEIFRILSDWNFWGKDIETGVPRPFYVKKLKRLIESKQVLAVIGARRSGKSFLMRQLAAELAHEGISKNNILTVNFEDPRFPSLNTELLDAIWSVYQEFMRPKEMPYIFFDEIQEVALWEKWIRTTHELGKAHITLSGSNAKLLSRELGTLLTGRHNDLAVYPLSFSEFLSFHDISAASHTERLLRKTEISGLLREYFKTGGFPAVVKETEKEKYLLSYFNDLVEKDIIRRYRIRKPEKLKALLKFYMSNTATLTTANSASKFLDISPDTVEKFSGYFEQAFLVFFLKRFSFKVREQEKSPRKIYCIDQGLANAVGFQVGERAGRTAENIVFLELLRQKINDPKLELFYWKNEYHHEADFVVRRGNEIMDVLQVCWNMSDPKTREREIRSLLKALDALNVTHGTIITETETGEEIIKGKTISHVPITEWLLSA